MDQGGSLKDFPGFKLAANNLTGAIHGIVDWFNKDNDYKNQFPYQIMIEKMDEQTALSYAARLLIHYIGDIHQPMHCVSRINKQYPNGDRGGNSFPLPNHYSAKELHAVWDGAMYEFKANDKMVLIEFLITLAIPRIRLDNPWRRMQQDDLEVYHQGQRV